MERRDDKRIHFRTDYLHLETDTGLEEDKKFRVLLGGDSILGEVISRNPAISNTEVEP